MDGGAATSVGAEGEKEVDTDDSSNVSQNGCLLKTYTKEDSSTAAEDMDVDVSGVTDESSAPYIRNLHDVGRGRFDSPQQATNGALDKSSPDKSSTPSQPDATVTPKRGLDSSSSSTESLSTPPSSGKNKGPNKRRSSAVDNTLNCDNTINDNSSASDNPAPVERLTPSKPSMQVGSSVNVSGKASDMSNQDSSKSDPNVNPDEPVLGGGLGSALFGASRVLHLQQQQVRQVAQPRTSYAGAASKGKSQDSNAIPESSLLPITRRKDRSVEIPASKPRVESGLIELSDVNDLKCGASGCVVDFFIVLPLRFDESLNKGASPDVRIIFGPVQLGNWKVGYRLESQSFSDDGRYCLYSGRFELPFMDTIDYKYAAVINKASSQRIKWEYIHCRETFHRYVGSGTCNRLLNTKGLTSGRICRQFDGCMESEHLLEEGFWARLAFKSTNKLKEETLRSDFTQCFHFLSPWNRQAGFMVHNEEQRAGLVSGIFEVASLFPILSTGLSQPLSHFFNFTKSECGISVAFEYLFDFVMKRLLTDDCSPMVYYSSALTILTAVKLLDGDHSTTRLSSDQQSKLLSLLTQPRSATEYMTKLCDDCRSHADEEHVETIQSSFRFLLSVCASPSDALCLVPWLHCLEMSRADPRLPSAVLNNSASWKFLQWADSVPWRLVKWRDFKAACAGPNWQPLLSCPVFQSIALDHCSFPRQIVEFDEFCGHRLSPAQLLRVFESSRFLRISVWKDRLFLVLFLAFVDRLDKPDAFARDNAALLLTSFLSRLAKAESGASATDDKTPSMIAALAVKVVCLVDKAVAFPVAGHTNLPSLWRRAVAVLLSEIFRAKLKLEQVSDLWLDLFAVSLNNLNVDEWFGLLAKHFSNSFGEKSDELLQFCFQTNFNKFSERSKRFCEVEAELCIQKRMEDPRVYDLNVGDKGRFADVLSKAFLAFWPKAASDIELLAFVVHWPPFKEVYETQYTRKGALWTDCIALLERAVAVIKHFYEQISTGSILVPDLDLIAQLKARFVATAKLCIPAIVESKLRQRLDVMEEASARYRRTKEFLRELCSLFCQVEAKIDDLSQLKLKLEQANPSFNDIHPQNDGSSVQCALSVAFFGLSSAWTVAEFERATKASRSAYWQRCWFDACDELPEPICINDTLSVLLNPVSDKARRFAKSFLHGSVKLGALTSIMERCDLKDANDLRCEVELLRDAFAIKQPFPFQERVKQVQMFLNATAAVAAGEVIMQVHSLLKLEGSFREVEAITSMASVSHDDMLLCNVNESVMKAGKNLAGISREQIECLRALLDAEDLIQWIYEMNAQEKDLHTFVELASSNVGESDIELALIANFNVCITAFAPLLFVPKNVGFVLFQRELERVWSALERNKTLPQKLRDSSKNVDRFKNLWNAQGSVEKYSIVQVEAINKHGIFRIGCISTEDHKKTLENSVVLAFDNEKDEHNLTLSKLKDLHSRLMLIGCQMNQNQAESKREIDRFSEIFDGVQRLTDLYVAHCAAGNVFFLEWQCDIVLDCGSSVNPTVKFHKIDRLLQGVNISAAESLNKLCVFFQTALEGWQEYMAKLRDQFPELNFYRNSQLVKLRRDLAELFESRSDNGQPVELDLSTQMLLMHIDPNVSIDKVNGCFQSYRQEPREEAQELMDGDLLSEDQQAFLAYLRDEEFIPEHLLKEAAMAADWSRDNVDEVVEFAASYDGLPPTKKPRTAAPIEAIDMQDGDIWRQLETRWKHHLKHQEATDDKDFVSLHHLGHTCKHLLELAPASTPSPLPAWLKANEPNLIKQPQLQLLKFCIAAYLTDNTAVFPNASSVLVCKPDMAKEDIRLFFLRLWKADPNQLYSIINAEVLRGDLAHVFEREVEALSNGKAHACLAVFCADEGFERSSIAGLMIRWQRTVPDINWDRIQTRVMQNLGKHSTEMKAQEALLHQRAVICTSIRSGQGKSLCVKRQVETLNRATATSYVKIPVHDSVVDSETMVPLLLKLEKPHSANRVIHIDILDSLSENIDGFLFELLVLGSLTDSRGQVWRFMPTDLYAIEVCSAPSKYLLPPNGELDMARSPDLFRFLFQAVLCLSPSHALKMMESGAVCYSGAGVALQPYERKELTSVPFQRCFWYLTNRQVRGFEAMDFVEQNDFPVTCDVQQLITTLLANMGINDPSWTEVKHFVSFFNVQLQDYERSTYCDYELMREDLPGFRTFLLSFLLEMARDFSTRSLEIAEEAMGVHEEAVGGVVMPQLEDYQPKRRWETCPHPYIFFNSDHHTLTFFGCYLDRAGNLIDLARPDEFIKRGIATRLLVTGLWRQGVDFTKTFDGLTRVEKLNTLRRVIGAEESDFDPDPNYEITADCAMKILAIFMRFRCGIPCVLMGETGVGKTKLVQFLCALEKGRPSSSSDNMTIVKVHGGTTYTHIRNAVETAQRTATPENPVCLFFDEANATNAISMLKEVMSDGTIDGRPLAEQGLNIVAAVNPYKKHSEEMIQKLESSGFGYRVNQTKAIEKFGNTPLRQLVYRVHRLPSSLLPLVWDFGTLKDDVEEIYISQMIDNFTKKLPTNAADGFRQASADIVKVISSAQRHMRRQEFEAKFVSLRDVERMLLVMQWLLKHEDPLFKLMNGKLTKKRKQVVASSVTRCVLLAVCVCYRATLQQHRDQFDRRMAEHFTGVLTLPSGAASFQDEIQAAQEVFIDRENITLDPNIAKNEALRENIFMMVACIELRIPLFIVGKPGSSKSLAKTIVAEAMRGPSAQGKLFKTFKKAALVSYQCSPLATAEGVELVFRQCARQQKDLSLDQYVAVAVFDEIGLAEDSPLLPLKALHGLLVEGCQIADEPLEAYHRVGFIGISNWALDPAKMNRGVFVSRILPTENELLITARQIAHGRDKKIAGLVMPFMEPLTTAYTELYQSQLSAHTAANALASSELKSIEFFGLRDFYSLVKMVYDATDIAKRRLRYNEMVRVIMRNFSGKDGDRTAAFHVFASKLNLVLTPEEPIYPKVEDLVHENLQSELSSRRENRYLLILTENYAALTLKSKIPKLKNALIIFGSSFPHDLEYTQICRNINKIKVCMDKGRPIILLNLESLYESLYDLLNQAFLMHGDERYVDLGLGTHRMKCHVHKEFRLIVIAQKAEVYQWPAALINRLEKHYFSLLMELNPEQRDLASTLDDWASEFATCSSWAQNSKTFEASDVFVGYSGKETAAAIIAEIGGTETIADVGSKTTLETAKRMLLQCATPESVVRALADSASSERKEAADWCFEVYFKEQSHKDLLTFLRNELLVPSLELKRFFQITTHSRLLSKVDLHFLAAEMNMQQKNIGCLQLVDFATELQFSNSITQVFMDAKAEERYLLIVQCFCDKSNLKLVDCARYLLEQIANDATHEASAKNVVVVLLLSLPRAPASGFVGFQLGSWSCHHVDDLMVQRAETEFDLTNCYPKSISQLCAEFIDSLQQMDAEGSACVNFLSLVKDCICSAAAAIQDPSADRAICRPALLTKLLDENDQFQEFVLRQLHKLHHEKESGDFASGPSAWFTRQAANVNDILEQRTFRQSLVKKIESSITPLLAGLFAAVDCGSNLDIITDAAVSVAYQQLWFKLANDLLAISYDADYFAAGEYRVPLAKFSVRRLSADADFTVSFPFSWLIKARIDKVFADICSLRETQDSSEVDVIGRCQSLLSSEPWSCPLFEEALPEQMLGDYIVDFIHMSCDVPSKQEAKLIGTWIRQVVGRRRVLPVVHSAFEMIQEHVKTLLLLTSKWPQAVVELMKEENVETCRQRFASAFDVLGFDFVVGTLETQIKEIAALDQKLPEAKRRWKSLHGQICAVTPFVSRLLSLRTGDQVTSLTEHLLELKSSWKLVQILRLFLDHMLLVDRVVLPIKQLWEMLQRLKNAFTVKFLETLMNVFTFCHNEWRTQLFGLSKNELSCALCSRPMSAEEILLPCLHLLHVCCGDRLIGMKQRMCPAKGCDKPLELQITSTAQTNLRNALAKFDHCRSALNSFFMEFVSSFLFADEAALPAEDVFEFLLRCVTQHTRTDTNAQTTSILSALRNDALAIDLTPVIRTFLLQVVLKLRPTLVKNYLRQYFQRNEPLMESSEDRKQLALLFVQCVEDTKNAEVPTDAHGQIEWVSENLRSQEFISGLETTPIDKRQLDVDWLFDLAVLRVVLATTANLVAELVSRKPGILLRHVEALLFRLETQLASQNLPRSFLCKQLCHVYGISVFKLVAQHPKCKWIVPEAISERFGQVGFADWALIYGEAYLRVKVQFLRTLGQTDDAAANDTETVWRASNDDERLYLFLAACNFASASPSAITREAIDRIWPILELNLANTKLHRWATLYIRNQHVSQLKRAFTDAGSSIPLNFIFQLIGILSFQNNNDIGGFFAHLLDNPDAFANSFLPTMPDNPVAVMMAEFRQLGPAAVYSCSNGHPYTIGDCTRPATIGTCPDCGVQIGGLNHQLVPGNRPAAANDFIEPNGYLLTGPTTGNVCLPERQLTSVQIGVIRALLNATLFCTSVFTREVCQRIVKKRQIADPTAFFLEMLRDDLAKLSRSLRLSLDDVCLYLVALIQGLNKCRTDGAPLGLAFSLLQAKAARDQWEAAFAGQLLTGIEANVERTLQGCRGLMMKDTYEGPLISVIFESASDTSTDLGSALWAFRRQQNVEALMVEALQQIRSSPQAASFALLSAFIANADTLAKLRYLPSVAWLHVFLKSHFCGILDLCSIWEETIGSFLHRFDANLSEKRRLEDSIRQFFEIWDILSVNMDNKMADKLRIPRDAFRFNSMNYTDCPLLLIVPINYRLGHCSIFVLGHLVEIQNRFIEEQKQFCGGPNTVLEFIDIYEATESQLLCFDLNEDVLPLLVMHRILEFTVGSAKLEASFDLIGLQRRISTKLFSHCRPLKIPSKTGLLKLKECLVLESILENSKKFAEVEVARGQRKDVIKSLSRNLPDVTAAVELVELLLKFAGSCSKDMELRDLILRLNLQDRLHNFALLNDFSFCELPSLWRILALEQKVLLFTAKQQELFSDDVLRKYAIDLDGGDAQQLMRKLQLGDAWLFLARLTQFIFLELQSSVGGVEHERVREHHDLNTYFDDLDFNLPDTILVKHAVTVWKIASQLYVIE